MDKYLSQNMSSKEMEINGIQQNQSLVDEKNGEQTLYDTFQQEYKILAEYKMLQSENLSGIYVIPSFESSFLWFGVVFVHSGFYSDGIFRFNIALPDSFPSGGYPTVIFQNDVFHPCIDLYTGTLDLSSGFPEWKTGENHLWQILKYIQWIFTNPQVKNPVNKEASDLLKNNKKLFSDKTAESVKISLKRLYDPPPTDDKHYITFDEYDSSIHDPVREALMSNTTNTGSSASGLSWIEQGTFRPLSKTTTDSDS